MSTAMDIDQLLEEAAAEALEKQQEQDRSESADRRSREHDDRNGRDRHRGGDRDGRRERDRERDRVDRYRESDNERHRSRERGRRRRDGSRTRSNKGADTDEDSTYRRRDDRDRDRSRERDRSRDRYRARRDDRRDDRREDRRSGDFYSGGGRPRSRSPRRYRDEPRDRPRYDRDRSRDRRRRDDERPRNGRRTATPPEPEATEDDRDKRTIFVQQISQRAETRHLRAFFERIGTVVEAQIVKDRVTGRSKGVGYVEFKDEAAVPKAIEQTGQRLKGVPIIAQHTEAEKNRASRAPDTASANANGAPFHRLYVGNIHFSVTETDLSLIFEPFGALEQITLQKEEGSNGLRSKGYGFVQYRDPAAAKAALEQMNGFELAQRPIRVGLGSDKFTPESTASLLRNFNSNAQNFQGSAFSGAGGRGAYAGGSGGVFDRTHGRDDRGVSGASALDDTDVAGININNMNRDRLMNLLARNPVEEPKKNGNAPAKARVPVVDKPMPSRCIKIQGAFDPDHELREFGVDWAKGIEGEVKTECNGKYGKVVHIAVDPDSDGDIFVKFDSVSAGEKAIQGLNGRNFNYRTIRADYVVDKIYNSLYGPAAEKY